MPVDREADRDFYLQKGRFLLYPVNQFAGLGDYFLFAICETASAMAPMLAPEARLRFARRLKAMRTQRGFDRARYFAKTLGIEENRYTRYERAEVEPNLTLIHKMCETLGVSPNELLGFGEAASRSIELAPGLAEASAGEMTRVHGHAGEGGNGPDHSSSLSWSLASEAVAIRQGQTGRPKSANDPMRALQETSALFRRLQADPFRTVMELVEERALKEADAARKFKLAELIRAFTDSVSEPAERRRR
jgi:transcriptional regulator with XRE-family HTH domain